MWESRLQIKCEPVTLHKLFNFKKKFKGQSLQVQQWKAILPKIGASWGGASPIGVETVAVLDEEAICFPFVAIFTVEIFEKIEKKLEAFVGSEKL